MRLIAAEASGATAFGPEIDLGRVDADQPHILGTARSANLDRVAVGNVGDIAPCRSDLAEAAAIHPLHRRFRRRPPEPHGHGRSSQACRRRRRRGSGDPAGSAVCLKEVCASCWVEKSEQSRSPPAAAAVVELPCRPSAREAVSTAVTASHPLSPTTARREGSGPSLANRQHVIPLGSFDSTRGSTGPAKRLGRVLKVNLLIRRAVAVDEERSTAIRGPLGCLRFCRRLCSRSCLGRLALLDRGQPGLDIVGAAPFTGGRAFTIPSRFPLLRPRRRASPKFSA